MPRYAYFTHSLRIRVGMIGFDHFGVSTSHAHHDVDVSSNQKHGSFGGAMSSTLGIATHQCT